MTDETNEGDEEREEEIGLDFGKMEESAVDLRTAVAIAEERAGGRVSLELEHAAEELETVIERLRRADAAAGRNGNNVSDAFDPGDLAYINEQDGGEA